ncbi:hypothetical protein H072_11034 [Dactylellina haptotyla CBS 200.50]|uniref:Uncharacterized protein n=1 Tax=Dactylellina haptotyla (strain CBS 200.50) TaxID=1284197 RepID=S8BJT0_DACHA|nr:hypothetical protein H072_11034 [Dactylellina haptotyla CBS 200.50]
MAGIELRFMVSNQSETLQAHLTYYPRGNTDARVFDDLISSRPEQKGAVTFGSEFHSFDHGDDYYLLRTKLPTGDDYHYKLYTSDGHLYIGGINENQFIAGGSKSKPEAVWKVETVNSSDPAPLALVIVVKADAVPRGPATNTFEIFGSGAVVIKDE